MKEAGRKRLLRFVCRLATPPRIVQSDVSSDSVVRGKIFFRRPRRPRPNPSRIHQMFFLGKDGREPRPGPPVAPPFHLLRSPRMGRYLGKRFCKMFSESSTVLQLPRQGRGTLRKLFTKSLTHVTARPSILSFLRRPKYRAKRVLAFVVNMQSKKS